MTCLSRKRYKTNSEIFERSELNGGIFMICNKPVNHKWALKTYAMFHCREQFHGKLPSIPDRNYFIFAFQASHSHSKIGEYIFLVEEQLRIREKSILYPLSLFNGSGREKRKLVRSNENRLKGVLVEMSPFWMKRGDVIKSLFTLLLRASLYHSKEQHILKTATHCHYLYETRYALELFLNGHTECKQLAGMWHSTFRNILPQKSLELLSKPTEFSNGDV